MKKGHEGTFTWNRDVENAVSRALAVRRKSGFWGVNNYWNLCALPEAASVDVAVFHHSFALHDLRIRGRSTFAGVAQCSDSCDREQAEQLDDPLYD